VRTLLDNWPFGDILCKLLPFATSVSVYVSVFSMTVIAWDRYNVLMRPLKQRTDKVKVPKPAMLAIIWFFACVLSIPNGIFNRVVDATIDNFEFIRISRCRTEYSEDWRVFFIKSTTSLTVMGQYLIPLTVVATCYTMIGLKILKRPCIGAATEAQWQIHSTAKRRTIKMLILVVVVFAICWAPYNTLHVLEDFFGLEPAFYWQVGTHWFAISSIAANPFIYFWLSPGYRDGVRYFLAIFGIKIGGQTSRKRNASRLHRMESGNTVCEMTINNVDLHRPSNGNNNGTGSSAANGQPTMTTTCSSSPGTNCTSSKITTTTYGSSNESIESESGSSAKKERKFGCNLNRKHKHKKTALTTRRHETEIECLTMDGRDGETALL